MENNYRQKISDLVQYINTRLIGEVPRDIYDPEQTVRCALQADGSLKNVQNFMGCTTTLLLLNSFLKNNTLIEGGSGTGKTKLASVIGSLLFQIPYELFERRRIVGTPGAVVNEIYATNDISELSKGNDVAFLYLPFYAPLLIVDELNRFSELEQNRIREGIGAKTWNYANHSWIVKNQLVISAINPESYGGTFILNENLLDNYSISLEPALYNPLYHSELVEKADERFMKDLGLESVVDDLMKFYSTEKNDPKAIRSKIKDVQDKTLKAYEARGIPFIHNGDIDKIKEEIEAVKFSPDGEVFFNLVLSETTYSNMFGRLRYDDPTSDDSHDIPYLSTKIKETLGGRFLKSWRQISKAIAWYMGKDSVGIDELRAGFLYASNRRLKPEKKFYNDSFTGKRKVPANFKVAKNVMDAAWKNYSDFRGDSKNPNPAFNHVKTALLILAGDKEGCITDVIKMLGRTDHPMAEEVLEAIAIKRYYEILRGK